MEFPWPCPAAALAIIGGGTILAATAGWRLCRYPQAANGPGALVDRGPARRSPPQCPVLRAAGAEPAQPAAVDGRSVPEDEVVLYADTSASCRKPIPSTARSPSASAASWRSCAWRRPSRATAWNSRCSPKARIHRAGQPPGRARRLHRRSGRRERPALRPCAGRRSLKEPYDIARARVRRDRGTRRRRKRRPSTFGEHGRSGRTCRLCATIDEAFASSSGRPTPQGKRGSLPHRPCGG